MLHDQPIRVTAGLLAQLREQRNVAAEDGLQRRADAADDAPRTNDHAANHADVPHQAVTRQFECRRDESRIDGLHGMPLLVAQFLPRQCNEQRNEKNRTHDLPEANAVPLIERCARDRKARFTVGIPAAGEHAVERDAECEDVGSFVGQRAGEKLRRDVAARARRLDRMRLFEPPQPRDAEIDELQAAARFENRVPPAVSET